MFTLQKRSDQTSTDPVAGSIRAGLRERREARAAYRALQADLATYTSDADVNDLLALLSHHDGEQAEQMRNILTDNLVHRTRAAA